VKLSCLTLAVAPSQVAETTLPNVVFKVKSVIGCPFVTVMVVTAPSTVPVIVDPLTLFIYFASVFIFAKFGFAAC
jgi:hypothetical protein